MNSNSNQRDGDAIVSMLTQISSGKYAAWLDEFSRTIAERRAVKARDGMSQIKVGDDVRFNDRIRPTYLRGLTAKVVKINGKSVKVDIDANPAYGRFSGAR